MKNETTREAIRKAMADWNAATPEQRAEALAKAAALAQQAQERGK